MTNQNKDAVITVQGGGLFGLSLLGQIQAVIEDHQYTPLALAGTSAGAIVASLVWGRLPPRKIRDEFCKIIKGEKNGLFDLLGPIESPSPSEMSYLADLKTQFNEIISCISSPKKGIKSLINYYNTARQSYEFFKNCNPHYQQRGFFTGKKLESLIDNLLRQADDVPLGITKPGELLRFRDFKDLMTKDPVRSYRPPLLITATNLTNRKLEVISSIDSKYDNMPIASAVRASAGYPVFFRPIEIEGSPDGGWFVDGGMVSNFPSWVFSSAFRKQLGEYKVYRTLASKPWINIGLRVVEDASIRPDLEEPWEFFNSLRSMVTGKARDQLEEILAHSAGRSIIIEQPESTTNGPTNFLAVHEFDTAKIDSMVTRGREFADSKLKEAGVPGIFSNTEHDLIETKLEGLIEKCNLILAQSANNILRANVFISDGDKLILKYSSNMDNDADKYIEFPDLQSGLVGLCYNSRCPQICNLEEVKRLRQTDPSHFGHLFGMSPDLQQRVREDRTWLASVPIFDPYEMKLSSTERINLQQAPYNTKFTCGLSSKVGGPVIGILGVDAGWNYEEMGLDKDPDLHIRDPRIQAILDLMRSTAITLAEEITAVFTINK